MSFDNTFSTSPSLLSGVVLTRHARYRHGQLMLEYYLKTVQGPMLLTLDHQHVVCFVKQQDADVITRLMPSIQVKPITLTTFNYEAVSAVYLPTSQALKQLQRLANDAGIVLYETDIRPEQRYLIERFISFDIECEGALSSASFPIIHGARARKPKTSQTIPLKVVSLDLECSMQGELYSVGLYGSDIQIGHGPTSPIIKHVIMVGEPQLGASEHVEIIWVKNEAALINTLIDWFKVHDPDVLIGWSVIGFDLALLYKRCLLNNISPKFGRNQQALAWKVEDKYRPETLDLPGRVVLDGIDWLKAAFYQFDSFSLEFVSRALLDEGKDIHDVDNRGQEITTLFYKDKIALANYNITDCRLVWDIFEKTDLLTFAIERAKLTGLEFGRVGASIAAFNHLYLPHLHRAGFIAPAMPASNGLESPGGYVMDSIPGYYKDVLVLDFKSLYPSIIRTFLIDPKGLAEGERIAKEAQEPEPLLVDGFLGAKFSRHTPILPELIAHLAKQREKAKRESNAPLSQAIKIIMNSLYGVLGSKGCVFHDAKLASSITMRGHQIMKQTKAWIEELGYKVIYGDTDSTFVWLGENVKQEPKEIGSMLSQFITGKWREKCIEQHKLTSYLELEFESHFEQFIMPTLRGSDLGSKKRYVGLKQNKQGEPKIIFKGMEQVRSDWSPIAKRIQLELYQRFFKGLDIDEYLLRQIELLKQGRFDDELVFKKRLKRHVADYTQQSAPHVKAASLMAKYNGDETWLKRGTLIRYVITTQGVQPVDSEMYKTARILDYQYYIEKQIIPIAEPLFSLQSIDIQQLLNGQMTLL